MAHQIIDNRNKKLADEINQQLDYTSKAKIAVGYFFLSGLQAIQDKLNLKETDGSYKIKEVRLIIGNTSNRPTIEELARSYRQLRLISREVEKQKYPKLADRKYELTKTISDIKNVISDLDQTNKNESLVQLLRQMILDRRLKVKVYTKSRLHAKAYIFDFNNPQPQSKGIAIVGSSNLSLAGLTNNTELNVYVHDNGENHDELTRWFNELWYEAEDFDVALLKEMEESWAVKTATPYDIYMKTLYTLVKDRLEGEDDKEFLWTNEITEALAEFQKNAVRQLVGIIKHFNGAFAADVVGVGKSYIGAAVLKHFSITENTKSLIICPKSLEDMWENYNAQYSLNAEVVPMSILREGDPDSDEWNFLVSDVKYRDRDFILVDESHHFRHHSPQRYKVLQDFLQTGYKKVLLLTATPRNKSAMDVYNQIKLFHPGDITYIPIDPPNLKEYFKKIVNNDTPKDISNNLFKSLLQYVLIRRTRTHILRWYGYDSETNQKVDPDDFEDYVNGKRRAYIIVGGKRRFFPRREIETIKYSIADTYQGLYQEIRRHLGKARFDYKKKPIPGELTYARFALWHYVKQEKQKQKPYNDLQRAGINLRGLMRVLLFKRFESSVYAFRMTIKRLIKVQNAFITSLNEGIIPAGEDAQKLLYGSDNYSEEDLIQELRKVTGKYDANDFDIERLKKHIEHDRDILEKILEIVDKDKIPPEKDAKLQKLKGILSRVPLNIGKVIIFSESAETVDYLYDNLNPSNNPVIRKASTGIENKNSLVNRFAPKANKYTLRKGEDEIRMLISTDVLSEGLNLQDCDKVINYDLHWNPVKLIQRFGRIDRIGSEYDKVYGFNFLPDTELDKNLNLREIVSRRIQEIHDTIGQDTEILDKTEQINHEAMYAIYETNMKQLSLFEEEDESIGLNEAEEIIRQLKEENPKEFNRISNLRDGIRSSVKIDGNTYYIFCQAGNYNQLFLVDKNGKIVNRDITGILGKLKSQSGKPVQPLPKGYNGIVQKVKTQFNEEIEKRFVEQKHTFNLTAAQKYVVSELKLIYSEIESEDLRAQINLLDKAFRNVNRIAVQSELNKIKRNKLNGMPLINKLTEIFTRHNLQEIVERSALLEEAVVLPKIICSEIF